MSRKHYTAYNVSDSEIISQMKVIDNHGDSWRILGINNIGINIFYGFITFETLLKSFRKENGEPFGKLK